MEARGTHVELRDVAAGSEGDQRQTVMGRTTMADGVTLDSPCSAAAGL
jgi:hypothetical protein